jgi:Arc/MetJ-type ribon-helix-helix transcriptional regulator
MPDEREILASLRQSLAQMAGEIEEQAEARRYEATASATRQELRAWAQRLRSLAEIPGQEQKEKNGESRMDEPSHANIGNTRPPTD